MSDCPAMSSCTDQFSVSYSGSRRCYLVTASQPSHCLWPITPIYPQHLQSLDYRGRRVHPCLFFLVTIYTPVYLYTTNLCHMESWESFLSGTCCHMRHASSGVLLPRRALYLAFLARSSPCAGVGRNAQHSPRVLHRELKESPGFRKPNK